MNFEILIPITLFFTVAYVIKVVVDARVKRQLLNTHESQELLRSILQTEELRQRHSSLRWGITLVALGVGFGLIEAFSWDTVTPGVIAVLVGATGLGNLLYWKLSRTAV